MREQAITEAVWNAFDLFSLRAMGLELDDDVLVTDDAEIRVRPR